MVQAAAGPAVVAVVGPTATGKSDAAVALAGLLGSPIEVVNADAMQLYRGLDIGTAKLPVDRRGGVPHHLLDLWPVAHRASVVEYRQAARAAVADVLARGALPVVVGGSGLYLRALLDELDVPPTDPVVRARYQERLAQEGPAALHAELAGRAPDAAQAIDPANGRRIVRALEVVELVGSFTARLPAEPAQWRPTRWFALDGRDDWLDARIDERAAAIWQHGLLAEAAGLLPQGLAQSPTAARAVGYQEALAVLAGDLDEPSAVARTALRTRQLVRRQRKWFRRDRRIRWLDAAAGPGAAASRIASALAAAAC
jgi:tRNA dimethylallyltransferase